MCRKKRYMELAKRLAEQSEYGKFKHGAVLVQGGSVLNCSYNKDNYNSFGSRFRTADMGRATLHAELGCILGMPRAKTTGATMYVARVNSLGKEKISKPCTMCQGVLKHVGVKRVIYTTNDEGRHEVMKL
jgi:tRNA(Arg) A34 adenosine deaminase TadA